MEKVFACATAMAAPSASPGHHDEDDDHGDHHDYQDNDDQGDHHDYQDNDDRCHCDGWLWW